MERVTTSPDTERGVTVNRVADPALPSPTTTDEVCDVVRTAIGRKSRLRIVGRGTWLDAGRPVPDAQAVTLAQMSGIVDYTPGDLTLTARAGTPLAAIAAATAPHGQWLALVPWGGDAGTLGATAATATAGPASGALGTPRDNIIGLEVVTGTGDVVRGGGRVVKNVAGFDLTRLMIGAWGTLGVLTEISVRLRALPEREVTIAMPVPPAVARLADLVTRLRAMPVTPLAIELVNAALARRLGLSDETMLLVRLAGNEDSVAAQRDLLTALGDPADVASDTWEALRLVDGAESSTFRFSGPAARFPDTWAAALQVASAGGGFVHATVVRSLARVVVPNVDGRLPDAVRAALQTTRVENRVFERLPAPDWPALAPSPVDDRLSRGIRSAFDAGRIFNPGILGEAAT